MPRLNVSDAKGEGWKLRNVCVSNWWSIFYDLSTSVHSEISFFVFVLAYNVRKRKKWMQVPRVMESGDRERGSRQKEVFTTGGFAKGFNSGEAGPRCRSADFITEEFLYVRMSVSQSVRTSLVRFHSYFVALCTSCVPLHTSHFFFPSYFLPQIHPVPKLTFNMDFQKL